jgi:hypothetical protein
MEPFRRHFSRLQKFPELEYGIEIFQDAQQVFRANPRKILYFEDDMEGSWFEKYKMKDLVFAIKST